MCGIVGVLARAGELPDTGTIVAAAERLRRRGPDDAGLWAEGRVALAHRRLAVLDLSASGHQPMVSADGRYVIVLNGEVYNFRELRAELAGPGVTWRSETDTETVLAAYARWGTDCVRRLRGMFAFAMWDRREQRLFAARDRLGVKPFYYRHAHGRFAFASRPRALPAAGGSPAETVDLQALRYYLEIGYVPAPLSIFREVRKLPPAHWLSLDASGLQVERYWDFRHIRPERGWEQRPEEDLLDELDEILRRSVRWRMVSDVPVGAFLSGGIDSSLVVAMMAQTGGGPVRTFTIGFEEREYDESAHAEAVARTLGTVHVTETLGVAELLDLLPTFVEEFDEPFYDSSAFPTLAVSRMAREQVTVALSGDGGDELFGGYHYYRIAAGLAQAMRVPLRARRLAGRLVSLLPGHRAKLAGAVIREPTVGSGFAFARSIGKDFESVLREDVLRETGSVRELFAAAERELGEGLDPTDRVMRLDAIYTLPDDYLQKIDVGTMAFSLESREPLLDHDLVEWAMRLPLSWKLRAGTNKYLLRRLAYRYVPERLLTRPKQGFTVPIDRWLRGPLRAWAREVLSDPRSYERLPLDRGRVEALLSLHLSGRRNAHPLLWAILMLLAFFERHGSGTSGAAGTYGRYAGAIADRGSSDAAAVCGAGTAGSSSPGAA